MQTWWEGLASFSSVFLRFALGLSFLSAVADRFGFHALVVFARRKRTMMKAARIDTCGPPSVLVIDALPRPAPGHGEVLVRVAAAGVGP